VPVGRHTIVASYLGYEPSVIAHLQVTSGKEVVLEIELRESAITLDEAVIEAHADKSAVLNEMALISARGFSVEETSRYASSFHDPARMARNFAGVSVAGGSSDLFNEIIVRGNSPRGVLWRLEGVEIPNPNHFGSLGNTGGGISMLSSSTLASSDFYTGAFPAEFGNASSGVFDLNMRKGNSEQREYSFMVGLLGLEAALEGPFSKNSEASYLFNFRYSTLGLLEGLGLSPTGDVLPKYGDLSFNVNIPTKVGTFGIFGLAGANSAYHKPEPDSIAWEDSSEGNDGFDETQKMGVIGISHKLLITDNSYLRTVVSASTEVYGGNGYWLDKDKDYEEVFDYDYDFEDVSYRVSSTYTHKLNSRHTFKGGGILSLKTFEFFTRERDDDTGELVTYLQGNGDATQVQAFGQWRYRMTDDLTVTGGLHVNYFSLNGQFSVEPRLAAKWQAFEKHSFSAAVGLHSKPEHPVFYYAGGESSTGIPETPNLDLKYTQSLHTVIGYEWRLRSDLRFNVEAYYQYLYNVPVPTDITENGSMLNVTSIWDAIYAGPAVNDGNGYNIGLDFTVEKNYSRNYYVLFTGSIFDSKYRTINGDWFNTIFSSKFQANLLGGKEWQLGKDKNNVFGADIKFVLNGGERTTPILLDESMAEGHTVRDHSREYAKSVGTYYRVDLGVHYKVNRPSLTHTISLDIQNVTGRLNPLGDYYEPAIQAVDYDYHTGLFPVLNYRIEF